ncbi:hypothetical protein LXA43DRAFT_1039548 [Ganoderma leucocontextum]|nr:hypothetical protein LXA43DRAFT_1039548 [Ganoderma leucocontextum]
MGPVTSDQGDRVEGGSQFPTNIHRNAASSVTPWAELVDGATNERTVAPAGPSSAQQHGADTPGLSTQFQYLAPSYQPSVPRMCVSSDHIAGPRSSSVAAAPFSAAPGAGEVQPWSARRDSAFSLPPPRAPEMGLSFSPLGAGGALPQPEGAPLLFLDAPTVESASSQRTEGGPSSDYLCEDLVPQRRRKRGRPPKMESMGTPAVQSSSSKGKGLARSPSEDALGVEEDDERPAKRSRRHFI